MIIKQTLLKDKMMKATKGNTVKFRTMFFGVLTGTVVKVEGKKVTVKGNSGQLVINEAQIIETL